MKSGKYRVLATGVFIIAMLLLITGVLKMYIETSPLTTPTKITVLCIAAAVPLFIIYAVCIRQISSAEKKERRNLKREIDDMKLQLDSEKQVIKEERESTEAILCKLQPGFIYDALRSIAGMCNRNTCGNPKATDALSELEKYLYVNLDAVKRNEEHSFERELNHIITYIKLEEMRLDRRINVIYNCKETVFLVPMLAVQALVESAVSRVIKDEDEKRIILSVHKNSDSFIVSVADNAKLPDSKTYIEKEVERIEGVRNQLKRYKINLLYSTNRDETTAVIKIPKSM